MDRPSQPIRYPQELKGPTVPDAREDDIGIAQEAGDGEVARPDLAPLSSLPKNAVSITAGC